MRKSADLRQGFCIDIGNARSLSDYLYECIQRHKVAPEFIIVGISEEEPPQQELKLAASLNRLRLCGFDLSIDDFGSGISTMKLLSQMPFTEIRIDRHFVRQFIENARQMDVLAAMGCVCGQGYIAAPMKQDEFVSRVGAHQLFRCGSANF